MRRQFHDCLDCGVNTQQIKELVIFLITLSVRNKTGLCDGEGSLCLGCLEKRIGYKLRPSDFTDWSHKKADSQEPKERLQLSERLHDRLEIKRQRLPVKKEKVK
jgi:hypothetical protein